MSQLFVYDLETTGLSTKRDKIIEIYIYNVDKEVCLHKLINPECEIPSESISVHGLTNMDLKNKPVFKEVVEDIIDFVGKSGYLVSHNNNQFDHPFLEAEFKKANKKLPRGWKFIDTLHLARIAYPELTNFKQDTLREMCGISSDGSHRANKDVKDLAVIYHRIVKDLNLETVEDVYELSENFTFNKMPFGKHKNVDLKKVPKDYIMWMIENGIITEEKHNILFRSLIKHGILKLKNKKKQKKRRSRY